MRSMANYSVHYSKSKIRGQKHPRDVVMIRNSIPNIKVNTLQAKIVNIRYRATSAREGQATTGHPFAHQKTHNDTLRPLSRTQIHSYIYTLVQTIISVQAELKVVRRKRIVYPTYFGAYSSTCCKETDNSAGTMELISSSLHGQTLNNANNDKVLRYILPP